MKALSLSFFFLALSLPAMALESTDQPEMICAAIGCEDGSLGKSNPGTPEVREERKIQHDEFKAEREALRAKFKALRDERKAAMKAARELEGEERKAAIKAAIDKFKAELVALRAERKALREKYHMAAANKADAALALNARKNEEVSQEILAADEEAQSEEKIAEAPAASQVRSPASQNSEKANGRSGSRVSAQ